MGFCVFETHMKVFKLSQIAEVLRQHRLFFNDTANYWFMFYEFMKFYWNY